MEFVPELPDTTEEIKILEFESDSCLWILETKEGGIRLWNKVGRFQHFQKNGLWEELDML